MADGAGPTSDAGAPEKERFSALRTRVVTTLCLAVPVIVILIGSSYSPVIKNILIVLWTAALLVAGFEFARCCTSPFPDGALPAPEAVVRRWWYGATFALPPVAVALALLFGDLEGPGRALAAAGVTGAAAAMSFALAVALMVRAGGDHLDEAGLVSRELFLGIFLVGCGGASILLLTAIPDGVRPLLWLLLTVIATDVGAYFGGSRFRGPLLARLISPKKTRSGACGGALFALLVGTITYLLSFVENYSMQAVCVAAVSSLVVSLVSQTGDLAKSFVKRIHRRKDMGTILPGHGGVLDRIDGILSAAPIALALVFAGLIG